RLEAKEIATIIYGNGEVQTFEQTQTQAPVQVQTPVQTQTYAPNMQGYQPYNNYAQPYSMVNYKAMQKMREDSIKAVKKEEKKLAFKAKMDAIPTYHFLLANYAYTFNNSHNVGLTYGWCHAVGVYVNMMLGVSGFHYKADYKQQINPWSTDYVPTEKQLTNEHTLQRISITPGLLVRLGCPLYWNVGLGYAYTSQTNKATDGRWAKLDIKEIDAGGLCFQTGLVANIKGFSLMANYSFTGLVPAVMNHEILIGIGCALDAKKGGKK
ncbi:MAG: hypothetical protein MJZ03_05205, partial [archaeon]|nr:hypothetical protein [archaeon]